MKKTVLVRDILFILMILAAVLFAPAFSFAHSTANCTNLAKNISIGSKDPSVTSLQAFLHAKGYLASEPTGYFGPMTFAAVIKFQSSQNISPIGSVGPLTRAAIQKVSCAATVSTPPPSTPTPVTVAAVAETKPAILTLPYQSNQFSNWKTTWGSSTKPMGGPMVVKATPTTQGAESILVGSEAWTNYSYSADVSVWNGDVTLITRYKDSENFAACTFSGNTVSTQQRVNGEITFISWATMPSFSNASYFAKSMSLTMTIKGQTLTCLGGPGVEAVATIDPSLTKGALGIQTWYPTPGAATLELRGVSVK